MCISAFISAFISASSSSGGDGPGRALKESKPPLTRWMPPLLLGIKDDIADQPACVVYDLVKNHQALSDLTALNVEGLPGETLLGILKTHPELPHLASYPQPNVAVATPHSAHALTHTDDRSLAGIAGERCVFLDRSYKQSRLLRMGV